MEKMSRSNAEQFAIQIATASVSWQEVTPSQFDDRVTAVLEIYDDVLSKLSSRIDDILHV